MTIRKLTTTDYMLILVNLVPVYGVWFEGWSAAQIFLVFCLETIIIGCFNVVKMLCVNFFGSPGDTGTVVNSVLKLGGLFLTAFFVVHYGFFVFVQTQIFFGVSGLIKSNSLLNSYREIPEALGPDGQLVLLIFITYYTLHNLHNFFLSGEYRRISMAKLMFQPYGRIFIQQVVVIAGAMFIAMGFNTVFIMILVLVKLFFDLFVNFDAFIDKEEAKAKEKMQQVNLTKPGQPSS